MLLGFFTIMVDAMIVNVALPSIGRGFDSGMTGLQWVVDGYTLAFAAFLLSAGAISDRVGARQAFAGAWACSSWRPRCAGWRRTWAFWWRRGWCRSRGRDGRTVLLALLREVFPDPAARARAIALWG